MKEKLIKAALLHDIGKLLQRAEGSKIRHQDIGRDFLTKFIPEEDIILQGVACHHQEDIKKKKLPETDPSYIVYEADNIASWMDRRDKENEDQQEAGFKPLSCLENIFNTLYGHKQGEESVFPVVAEAGKGRMPYPEPKGYLMNTKGQYQELKERLENNLQQINLAEADVDEILQLLEPITAYVPACTKLDQVADISLYDHQKLTAAVAGCMYDYFQAEGIGDYKKYCFGSQSKALREKKIFLLVGGDLSGIQKFIYTIPSAGALKSLRGRSFYLELLLENVADDILAELELNRTNLIYTGGGNFYLLLPNTEKVKSKLGDIGKKVNKWLLKHFGTALYLALGWGECSGNDFKDESPEGLAPVYQEVKRKIFQQKYNRYEREDLQRLFSPGSEFNRVEAGNRECSICHSSGKLLSYGEQEDSTTMVCPNCLALKEMGNSLLSRDILAIFTQPKKGAMPLPGDKYLSPMTEEEINSLEAGELEEIKRIYVKNKFAIGGLVKKVIWMGDYTSRWGNGTVLNFQELAGCSGDEEQGINRLGVLRADVDSLGAAFIQGFSKKYRTMSRQAVLSRQLSIFFKRYINDICRGHVPPQCQEGNFYLFGPKERATEGKRVHIVYSGGDDMFLVGAWDELIEVAVDIHNAFKAFSNGKLTFSAGLGMFSPGHPIADMARRTGELESYAKDNPEKNSIAFFGSGEGPLNRWTWEDFIGRVWGEKLKFLQANITFKDNEKGKLCIGKGKIYRLVEFLRGRDQECNLARFAYTLARLAPAEDSLEYRSYQRVREKFYLWYKSKGDCKDLIMALELMIYRHRAKEGYRDEGK